MSEVFTLLEQIDDAYALYRSEKASPPKYLILGLEHRQAIKVEAHFEENPKADIRYMGIPIIPYEDVVILRTRPPHLTFEEFINKYNRGVEEGGFRVKSVDEPHDGPEIESIDRVIAPSGWLHRLLWTFWHRYVLRDFINMEARRGDKWPKMETMNYGEFLKAYDELHPDDKKPSTLINAMKRQGIKIHVEYPTTYLDEIEPE